MVEFGCLTGKGGRFYDFSMLTPLRTFRSDRSLLLNKLSKLVEIFSAVTSL